MAPLFVYRYTFVSMWVVTARFKTKKNDMKSIHIILPKKSLKIVLFA